MAWDGLILGDWSGVGIDPQYTVDPQYVFEGLKSTSINFQCIRILHICRTIQINETIFLKHTYCHIDVIGRSMTDIYGDFKSRPECEFLAFEKVCLDFTRGAFGGSC